jgi:glutathione S-transferase
MKLYGFPLSPFVRKVALVLAEKGLEFDWEPTNPRAPSADFTAASPLGKIPAFTDGDYALADSTAIAVYLDTAHHAPALLPADAKARGKAVWFDEMIDTVLVPTGVPIIFNRLVKPMFFNEPGDEEAALAGVEALKTPLAYLEGVASTNGYLAGAYGLGDIGFACVIRTLEYTGWSLDTDAYPALVALYDRVKARPAWQAIADREAAIMAAAGG